MKKPLLAVIVEGGMVQGIVSDGEPPDIDVIIIDYDTDNLTEAEEKELVCVPEADGSIAKAHAWCEEPHSALIDLRPVISHVYGLRERDPKAFNHLTDDERLAIADLAVEVCVEDALKHSDYLKDFILYHVNEMDVAAQLGAISGEEERQRELLGWNPRVQCRRCREKNLDECVGHTDAGPPCVSEGEAGG